jgi:hypothetical protein
MRTRSPEKEAAVPLRFNIDHSPACVENGPAVMPGETYDFTDEQVAAGIAGCWSENDPSRGTRQQQPVLEQARDEQTTDPAEPEDKEQQA